MENLVLLSKSVFTSLIVPFLVVLVLCTVQAIKEICKNLKSLKSRKKAVAVQLFVFALCFALVWFGSGKNPETTALLGLFVATLCITMFDVLVKVWDFYKIKKLAEISGADLQQVKDFVNSDDEDSAKK